jgi:hypothetical protein
VHCFAIFKREFFSTIEKKYERGKILYRDENAFGVCLIIVRKSRDEGTFDKNQLSFRIKFANLWVKRNEIKHLLGNFWAF